MNNSLYVDPVTGGYSVINNTMAHVHPSIVKVSNLLCQARGKYIYNIQSGNPLINNPDDFTQNEIINAINICLTPLVNSGDLINFTVINITASTVIRKRYTISIELLLPNGQTHILNWKTT